MSKNPQKYLKAQYCTVHPEHKNHVIRGISAHAFREQGIVFCQPMDQLKRCDGLQLLNEHGGPYFLTALFWCTIYPFKSEKFKNKIYRREKRIHMKRIWRPVTRRCKWPWKQRLDKSMSSKIEWFFPHIVYRIVPYARDFLTMKCFFKNTCFQLPQKYTMNRWNDARDKCQ